LIIIIIIKLKDESYHLCVFKKNTTETPVLKIPPCTVSRDQTTATFLFQVVYRKIASAPWL